MNFCPVLELNKVLLSFQPIRFGVTIGSQSESNDLCLKIILFSATTDRSPGWGNSSYENGEVFFQNVMDETGTMVTWPSKLKIGAKSKKDPHVKVCGLQENVKRAKEIILDKLDARSTRVTLKMDVPHTEHSHVIGKGILE